MSANMHVFVAEQHHVQQQSAYASVHALDRNLMHYGIQCNTDLLTCNLLVAVLGAHVADSSNVVFTPVVLGDVTVPQIAVEYVNAMFERFLPVGVNCCFDSQHRHVIKRREFLLLFSSFTMMRNKFCGLLSFVLIG